MRVWITGLIVGCAFGVGLAVGLLAGGDAPTVALPPASPAALPADSPQAAPTAPSAKRISELEEEVALLREQVAEAANPTATTSPAPKEPKKKPEAPVVSTEQREVWNELIDRWVDEAVTKYQYDKMSKFWMDHFVKFAKTWAKGTAAHVPDLREPALRSFALRMVELTHAYSEKRAGVSEQMGTLSTEERHALEAEQYEGYCREIGAAAENFVQRELTDAQREAFRATRIALQPASGMRGRPWLSLAERDEAQKKWEEWRAGVMARHGDMDARRRRKYVESHPDIPEERRSAILEGTVLVGMTIPQVLAIHGDPRAEAKGPSRRWLGFDAPSGGYVRIHFERARVSHIEKVR